MILRVALAALWFVAASAFCDDGSIGIVVMHGKGSSPSRSVGPLAQGLESRGLRVENLDMPWSGQRNYDVDVAAAEAEVQAALDRLRSGGAKTVFVAGHSQGGIFALHVGGRLKVDGVVAIAPGGDVASDVFRSRLSSSVADARRYVADGKGNERQRLMDFEGGRAYPIGAVPAAYVTWFDPDGAMNEFRALAALPKELPVLFVAPTRDYVGLRSVKDAVAKALPPSPLTHVFVPDADHLGAPAASVEEVARWTREVSAAKR